MPTSALPHYHDRHDPSENYDRHLFRAGSVLQSAELNEIQLAAHERLRGVADALFNDGAILSGAGITVNPDTGACICEAGAVYLRGAARGVPPRTFTVATAGLVSVGVYLMDTVVTELEDPGLRDPAISVRNYQEPGAARLKVDPAWGFAGDGQPGDFFAVYQIEDGLVLSKAPPPQVDAISSAIARYDRQSSGGYYVASGLNVTRVGESGGVQVYSMARGEARVNGAEIIREHSRRIEYAATPDTRTVVLEPHLAAGGTERVELNRGPVMAVTSVSMTREETITRTHGAFAGAIDALPRSPVVQIVAVTQDATTYTPGDDYVLTADAVDWTPAGAEPAPGSTYTVTYRWIATVAAIEPDATGFTAEDAVPGTLIQVTYSWAMPRYDRICLDESGDWVIVKGLASPVSPRVPAVPSGLLGIAVLHQRWGEPVEVLNNAVRMIPMSELNAVNRRIDDLFALAAEERLALNLTLADPTAKRGVFVDPFFDDDMRDTGIDQTGAIFGNELTLGLDATVATQSLAAPATLLFGYREEIAQTLVTGSMLVNPYDAFSVIPGRARLEPAVDFWTEFETRWLSPVTRRFSEDNWTNADRMQFWVDAWNNRDASLLTNRPWEFTTLERFMAFHTTVVDDDTSLTSVEIERVSRRLVDLQFLRRIEVRFFLEGFGVGEVLQSVVFDGISVPFEAAS